MTLIISVTATVLVGALMLSAQIPPSLAASKQPERVKITTQEYFDPQQVDVTVEAPPDLSARVARDGIVTAFGCSAGEVWKSGTSHISVDGSPLLAFHTSTPLWRDLEPGARGADVDAVKAELARLGQRVSSASALRRVDVSSMRALAQKAGADSSFDVISPTDLVWIPAAEIAPKSCDVTVGQRVSVDTAVMSSASPATVSITPLQKMLHGSRVLKADQVELPVTDKLTLADPKDASDLLSTASYRAAAQSASAPGIPVTLTAVLALAEPVTVSVLPPAAVRAESLTAGCIASDQGVVPVTIVASDLGRTLVVFDPSTRTPASTASLTPPRRCS
ncbi:hypothetical protein [Microbacterium bovistercoris]|uniref:hypothetical protein n=1 Tax=Microbacterium bovistercoris TaxID=2293570 RepID=UPI0011C056B4|nr:hypothetical protein [Microbacterium bovistercoris]